MWRLLWAAVVDSLFAPRCLGPNCGAPGRWLCERCLSLVAPLPEPLCGRCGVPVVNAGWCIRCATHEPPFERAVAAGRFDGVLREAIHALKYRRLTAVAAPLGLLAAETFGQPPPDAVVVPVPAHGQRVRERGVDHARQIAEAVARQWDRPCMPSLLRRTRDTRPQTGLTARQRQANVAGAFAASPLEGAAVVLVDDVMTSGATASSCAAALLVAGTEAVHVCTVARAMGRGERWPSVVAGGGRIPMARREQRAAMGCGSVSAHRRRLCVDEGA